MKTQWIHSYDHSQRWSSGVQLLVSAVMVLLLLLLSSAVNAERIKDIASIEGVRDNQLLGYGLVVGLDGSGDKVTFITFC